jgi:hypothetical protein
VAVPLPDFLAAGPVLQKLALVHLHDPFAGMIPPLFGLVSAQFGLQRIALFLGLLENARDALDIVLQKLCGGKDRGGDMAKEDSQTRNAN